jgi:hypothetical protein
MSGPDGLCATCGHAAVDHKVLGGCTWCGCAAFAAPQTRQPACPSCGKPWGTIRVGPESVAPYCWECDRPQSLADAAPQTRQPAEHWCPRCGHDDLTAAEPDGPLLERHTYIDPQIGPAYERHEYRAAAEGSEPLDDTRSPMGVRLAQLVLDAWNGTDDPEGLLARLDEILAAAYASQTSEEKP